MPETPHLQRERQLREIKHICGIAEDRVLCQRLDSLSECGVDVVHQLISRLDGDGLAGYWQKRAEAAEECVAGFDGSVS